MGWSQIKCMGLSNQIVRLRGSYEAGSAGHWSVVAQPDALAGRVQRLLDARIVRKHTPDSDCARLTRFPVQPAALQPWHRCVRIGRWRRRAAALHALHSMQPCGAPPVIAAGDVVTTRADGTILSHELSAVHCLALPLPTNKPALSAPPTLNPPHRRPPPPAPPPLPGRPRQPPAAAGRPLHHLQRAHGAQLRRRGRALGQHQRRPRSRHERHDRARHGHARRAARRLPRAGRGLPAGAAGEGRGGVGPLVGAQGQAGGGCGAAAAGHGPP
jgi:hypothetical protein